MLGHLGLLSAINVQHTCMYETVKTAHFNIHALIECSLQLEGIF